MKREGIKWAEDLPFNAAHPSSYERSEISLELEPLKHH